MASPQREVEAVSDDTKRERGANGSVGAEFPSDGFSEGFQRTASTARESLGKAIIQIILATLIFVGGLFLYWQHVQNQEKVRELAAQAKEAMIRDNPIDLAKAQKKLDEALALDAGHEYVIATKALLNARLFEQYGTEGAKAVAEKFTTLAEDKNVQKQERYGARALLDVAAGKYAETETRLVEIVNKGGRGPAIFEALGVSQRRQGKIGAARKSLRAAAESEWRNPRYNAMTTELYLQDNELQNAKSFAKKTLDANPNHILGLLLEARVNIARESDVLKAKENIDDILSRPESELNPFLTAYAKATQAEFLIYDRKYRLATQEAEAALALSPRLPVALFAKGVALAHTGNAAALPALQTAFEVYPYAPRPYHQAAIALLEKGRSDEAMEVMNLWGKNVAKDAAYHIAYGNLLLQKGDDQIPEAVKRFQEAIKDDPDAKEAYFRLGTIHQKAKEYDKAIDSYNKAVEISEQYAEVYEAMGWLYSEQGHFNDALPLFAKALTFYKAKRMPRKKLNDLRKAVGVALKKNRKYRRYYSPWLKESKDLIR